jgi:predicted dehydrogenase
MTEPKQSKDRGLSPMPASPMPVAVIGLGRVGEQLLEAITRSGSVEVVAVADLDRSRATAVAERLGVQAFTDSRSLLSQVQPAAVFVATPPAASVDLINDCAGRGIHVWKEAPLARTLGEAASLVRAMDQGGAQFMLATPRRFMASYRYAYDHRESLQGVHLAQAQYRFNWGPVTGWRADRQLAGGGALLELGWSMVDLLIWMLGMPEEVFAVNMVAPHHARPVTLENTTHPPIDTDDFCAAVMRLASGTMANLTLSRTTGPVHEGVSLFGMAGSTVATSEHVRRCDNDGNILDQHASLAGPLDGRVQQIEAFARAIASGKPLAQYSARAGLLPMAVIDAMYLSGRTGQAESPTELLKTAGLTVQDCQPWLIPAEDDEAR